MFYEEICGRGGRFCPPPPDVIGLSAYTSLTICVLSALNKTRSLENKNEICETPFPFELLETDVILLIC